MTLISHRYKFIYLKTLKTASTTVQHYFTKQLLKEHPLDFEKVLYSIEYEDDEIIIGFRAKRRHKRWYSHMPAYEVKEELDKIEPLIWKTYLKFTTVRNPFDYCVSHYLYTLHSANRPFYNKVLADTLRIMKNNPKLIFRGFYQSLHAYITQRKYRKITFEEYLKGKKLKRTSDDVQRNNWNIYTIDDKVVIDEFIKFEGLSSGIEEISDLVGLPFIASDIGNYISGVRPKNDDYRKYYTEEIKELVKQEFEKELELFGYAF